MVMPGSIISKTSLSDDFDFGLCSMYYEYGLKKHTVIPINKPASYNNIPQRLGIDKCGDSGRTPETENRGQSSAHTSFHS